MQRRRPALVDHPLYGKTPIESDVTLTIEEAAWVVSQKVPPGTSPALVRETYPRSALRANPMEQRYKSDLSAQQRLYWDALLTCSQCERAFLFFALEQRYWFETLQLPVDVARCTRCVECRQAERKVRGALRSYSAYSIRDELTDTQGVELLRATLVLVRLGLLKVEKAQRIRKRLAGRPEAAALVDELGEALAALPRRSRGGK